MLAVDPSSVRTGGSVLGDKTRMARLSADPNAYIRPSPTAGTLGGVARATVQSMAVLEAAAYDVVLVETVGVGQSEVTVAGMVDTFLFLTLARTGDQLQGIKKGILEIADVIAVNKADGDREQEARAAARELAGALRLVRGHGEWATAGGDLLGTARRRRRRAVAAGARAPRPPRERGLADKRAEPAARLHLGAGARRARAAAAPLARRAGVRDEVREAVLAGELPATVAADRILAAYDDPMGSHCPRVGESPVACGRVRGQSSSCPRGDRRMGPTPDARPTTRRGTPMRARPLAAAAAALALTGAALAGGPTSTAAPPRRPSPRSPPSPRAWSARSASPRRPTAPGTGRTPSRAGCTSRPGGTPTVVYKDKKAAPEGVSADGGVLRFTTGAENNKKGFISTLDGDISPC